MTEIPITIATSPTIAVTLDDDSVSVSVTTGSVSVPVSVTGVSSGGDMLASVYDPTTVSGDAFAMDNMVEGSTTKILTDAERSKLSGIESNATGDQTGAEIKSLYESESNTNAFTDAEKTLLGNQSGTNTGDQDLSTYQLQPSEGAFIDGDKTKLDAIESGATADQDASEIRSLVGSATDSNVFTDADHSKLDGIEVGANVTDAANVTAAGALMDSEVANLDDVKSFDPADYATAAQGATADTAIQPSDILGLTGGTTGQIATKASGDNYDLTWSDDLTVPGFLTADHIHGNIAGTLYVHVKNTSGGTLTKGTPVYVTGHVGVSDRVEVAAADQSNSAKMPAVALLADDLANNGEGDGVIVGEIRSFDTDTPGWSLNDEIFVGTSGLTSTQPTSGTVQPVATVGRIHASTGVLVINCQGQRSPDETFAEATHSHTLSDITDAGTAAASDTGDFATADQGTLADSATQPGDLGTAASLDVGTAANEIVQLDASAKLPAVDGSQLTNLPSGATQLSDLSDVNTSTATNRNALIADGTDFESRQLVEADISDLGNYITNITGESLADLSDVATTGPQLDAIKTKVDGIESGAEVNDPTTLVDADIGVNVQAYSSALDSVSGTNTGDQDLSSYQLKPSEGAFVDGDKTKLDGIESGATADQTGAEIKSAYEAEANTNAFTDAEKTLLGNQSGTNTGDQDLSSYQLQPSEGAFVDGDKTKLDGIEAGADVTDTTNVVSSLIAGTNITIAGDGTISATGTQLSNEEVQDIVGAMVTGNTESGITVAYDDTDGTLDFTVASQTDENFTTADHAKLDGIEAGADVTDTANVTSAGALMDSEVSNLDQIKAFDSSDYATAAQGTLADSATQPSDNISTLTNDSGFTGDQTAADIRALGFFDTSNDGAASGLDADLLDGNHASAFATAAQGSAADSALQSGDIDTLAELNSIVTDATLIDTADSRLSDSRTCDNTFDNASTARTNLGLGTAAVESAASLSPTGGVQAYAGSSSPTGWLICDGSAVSRTTYSNLFAVISTTYGVGDGSTTFNLPDISGRVIAGKEASATLLTSAGSGVDGATLGSTGGSQTHQLAENEMPIHDHDTSDRYDTTSRNMADTGSGVSVRLSNITTLARTVTSAGGDLAHQNTQPTIVLNYIIKT